MRNNAALNNIQVGNIFVDELGGKVEIIKINLNSFYSIVGIRMENNREDTVHVYNKEGREKFSSLYNLLDYWVNKMEYSNQVRRTERGWAGHFICAHDCRFRRNTLLEYENVRIVVSTVGRMINLNRNKFITIGYNRYFETMAFHAKYDGRYWDADITRGILLESSWSIEDVEAEDKANDMHETVVTEIIHRIIAGEFI